MTAPHPSRLALDRYALGIEPSLKEHVDDCATCRARVAAAQVQLPVPAWVAAPPPRRWWWAALVPVAALVLALVVPREHEATTAKGEPSAVLYVKHGQVSRRWQGEALKPGDAIRLELAAPGYRWYTVASLSAQPSILWSAQVSAQPSVTPAWALDDERAPEHLVVAFSTEPLTLEQLTPAQPGLRTIDFVIPRETP